MTYTSLITGAVLLCGGLLYFAYRAVRSYLVLARLTQAMDDLRSEVDASNRGGKACYRSPMPSSRDFIEERECTAELLKSLEQTEMELVMAPVLTKLSGAWKSQCRSLEAKARKKIRDLQSEAFWAQFKAGTAAAEARFSQHKLD